MTTTASPATAVAHEFLAGGGEMGARTRAFDWSKTALGPVDAWPQSLRSTVGMLLRTLGAHVRIAHDGPAASEAFGDYDPAIALLDVGMPGMNGYDLARVLRERDPDRRTTLVALTGWGQDEDRRRAREAGFDHHLVKPADIETLQRLISEASQRRGVASGNVAAADHTTAREIAAQAGPPLGD